MTENEMAVYLRECGYTVLSPKETDEVRNKTLAYAAEFVLAGYSRGLTGLQIATKLKIMSRKV